jgi:4-amino-4-deoxy-L-arabinose transferase-like glycosyltransferase
MGAMKKASLSSTLAPQPAARARAVSRAWTLWLGLGLLALGAFLLRALTIRQSLPFVDHPDEPNPIDYVVGMLRTGDPNQQFFQKPSLYIYLLLAALQAHYRWGQAAGLYGEIAEMVVTTHTVTTLPGFFLTARLVTAAFAALTVLSAYGLGVRGWGRGAGLAGALFVAVSPFHLRFSQWATTDVLATFLSSLSLGAALLALRGGRWSAYLVAGAFAGLAASAKYNAGAVAGAIVVAAALRAWEGEPATLARRLWREGVKLALAGAMAIACFVAGTPYALLSWGQVGGGIARQWNNYGGANGHYRGAWNVAGYGEFFLFDGLGVAGCLLTLAGLGMMAWRRPRTLAVWLGFALPSLLVHLSRATHFMQNMLPLVVACALPIGVAVSELPRLLGRRAPRMAPLVLALLLALTALPPLARSLATVGRQAAGDGRLELLAWIEAEAPPGSRIAAELKPVPGPTEARWTDAPFLPAHDLAWYRAQGYAYLVASSKRWGQMEPPAAYGPLLAGQVAEFGPRHPDEMLGPRLIVIATGLTADDAPVRPAGEVRVGGARLAGVAVGDPSADGEPPMLVPTRELRAGGVLGLRTFWEVEQPFAQDYLIFVHLLDGSGGRPTQRDAPPWQGRFPTSSWRPGSLVVDANDVYLPPGLAPGEYRVVVGMYDPASGARAAVTIDGAPQPDGMVEVATIRIVE